MPRAPSGSYTLPASMTGGSNPVITGTQITPGWANTTLADIATELTDSLSRTGNGGMTAPLRTADGTVAAPSFSFTNETGTGWYRSAAGVIRAAILGTYRLLLNATGLQVNGTLTVSGRIDRPSLPLVGQQVSSAVSLTSSAATWTTVTGLSVSITSTGRPVLVLLQPDGTATPSQIASSIVSSTTTTTQVRITRDGASLAVFQLSSYVQGTGEVLLGSPLSTVTYLDVVGAGTYAYLIQYQRGVAGTTTDITAAKLVAFEL